MTTYVMYDSIYPQTLPAGGDAYLGYVDGHWPTYNTVKAMFPGKLVIGLTVTGATLNADGCDIETGDLGPAAGAQWLKNKLATRPALPPVAYCSVDNMAAVVSGLAAIGVPRNAVLLLSAHYGAFNPGNFADPVNAHICGPQSCNAIDLPQDGTQWTDQATGNGGTSIDASQLTPAFFGTPKGNDMATLIRDETTGAAYLLDGGKAHYIAAGADLTAYAAELGAAINVSHAEITALLADFPPGNPAVTVTVPPVTVTIPPMNVTGTITPQAG